MACPLRVFLFLFSLLLLGAALAYHLAGQDAAFFTRREGRTWRAFLTALFTGELLYDAYHGAGAWHGSAGSGGILYCEEEPPLPPPQQQQQQQQQPAPIEAAAPPHAHND